MAAMRKKQTGLLGDAPTKKGLLGDAPTKPTPNFQHEAIHHAAYVPSPLVPPSFIDNHPCRGPLTNRCDNPDTYDVVSKTLRKYVVDSSNNVKTLTSKLLFSCYHKILLHLLGLVDQHLEKAPSKIFVPVITGGMSLRFYNPSYLTSDLDVKVYPLGLNSETLSTYEPETYMDTYVKPLFNYYLDVIMRQVNINAVLDEYVRNYLQPFYDDSQYAMVQSSGEILTTAIHNINFSFDYPEKFDEATKSFTSEKDRSVLKLICVINDGTPSKQIFKLMDISLYDPSNETYNTIVKGFYEKNKSIKVSNYIPPLSYVVLNMLPYYIVDLDFMEYEKEQLLTKYESNPYFSEKFTRSLKGIKGVKSGYKPYAFMGGKSKRKSKSKSKKHHTRRNKNRVTHTKKTRKHK